jgi:hypothetical protein
MNDNDLAKLARTIENIKRDLRELPPSIAASFAPLVADLQQTIYDLLASQYWTQTETASHIASPGDIAPGSVSAAGDVSGATGTFPSGLNSLDVHNREVIVGRLSVWIDETGQLGFQSSRRGAKKDLEPLTDTAALLSLTPYKGRYLADPQDAPLSMFLIAEDVAEAGFGPDVAPVDGDGNPFTVNYSQIVVPLLAVVKDQQARLDQQQAQIAALDEKLTAAGM